MTLYTKIIQSEDIKDINAVISKYNKYNHQRFFPNYWERERDTHAQRERERERERERDCTYGCLGKVSLNVMYSIKPTGMSTRKYTESTCNKMPMGRITYQNNMSKS